MERIAALCNTTAKTVSQSVKELIRLGYIAKRKIGKCYAYSFKKYLHFEKFSYEFLENRELSFKQKAYLVASQQFMLNKESGVGTILMNDFELGDKIHLCPNTIKKYDRELKAKNILTIVKSSYTNMETGCKENAKYYHFDQYNKAMIELAENHEERISENSKDIDKLNTRVYHLEKQLKDALHRVQELEEKPVRDKFIV